MNKQETNSNVQHKKAPNLSEVKPLRGLTYFVFFGVPEIAVWTLEKMKNCGLLPQKIVTFPDAPAGRGRKLKEAPTKTWAKENGVPFIEWENTQKTIEALSDEEYDFALVFAFGKILKKELLDLPNIKHGFINIHPSLLPKLRGPSPIRSAILLDEKDAVGVSIIKMDEKMDHGPILWQEKFDPASWPVPGRELDKALSELAGEILCKNIDEFLQGNALDKEQEHGKATFTKFFKKSDCEINFDDIDENGQILGNAKFVACACDGNPGTFFFADKNGKTLRIKISELSAKADSSYKQAKIYIKKLIPEGKKEMLWSDFKNFLNS